MVSPLFKSFLEAIVKKELDEFGAMAGGAVVGFQVPLGTNMKPIHKKFWSGDKKNKRARLKQ